MNYKSIPEEMRLLKRWLVAKADKIPRTINEENGLVYASVTNENHFLTFDVAEYLVRTGSAQYLGFVFFDDGIVGIDLDDCYSNDIMLTPMAVDVINALNSYTERSISGEGVHIIVKGDLSFDGRNMGIIEAYKKARYFLITTNTFYQTELRENQEGLDYVIEKYMDAEKEKKNRKGNIKADGKKIYIKRDDIMQGTRTTTLLSRAGTFRRMGLSEDNIFAELMKINQAQCVPPLSDEAVGRIVNSIMKYKE